MDDRTEIATRLCAAMLTRDSLTSDDVIASPKLAAELADKLLKELDATRPKPQQPFQQPGEFRSVMP